jgi:hypothetical protein
MYREQGAQIGRNFAYWVIVDFFEKYRNNCRTSLHFWPTIFHGKSYVLILAEKGPGYILGDYFKNSSGHPDRE